MTSRRSRTSRPHVSQIGKSAGDDVPGIRLTVTDNCTGHSHTEARDSTPIRVPPRRVARSRILIRPSILLATLAFFAATASVSAAFVMPPATMATALSTLGYPRAHPSNVTCKGIGTASSDGKYPGFRCAMRWRKPIRRAVVYAQGEPGGWICAGASLAGCHLLARGFIPTGTLFAPDPKAATLGLVQARLHLASAIINCTGSGPYVCSYDPSDPSKTATISFAKVKAGWIVTGSLQ